MGRVRGFVKWYNVEKGFGFLLTEDDVDVFVHFSNVVDGLKHPLVEGMIVEFGIVEDIRNGKMATEVEFSGQYVQ